MISLSTLAGSVTSRVVAGERDHVMAHVLGDADDILAEHPPRLR